MKLTIDIDDIGAVRIYVGGSQIGLVQNITLEAAKDGPPHVKIAFPPDEFLSDATRKAVQKYKEDLHMVPFAEVA
jgi:hypothetical protein